MGNSTAVQDSLLLMPSPLLQLTWQQEGHRACLAA